MEMEESPSLPETDDPTTTTTNTVNTHLDCCNHLVSALLDEHLQLQIQSFRGKWSLLRTKLSSLHSSFLQILLNDDEDDDCSSSSFSSPLFSDLLSSLSSTLSSALTLADSCRLHPPDRLPAGKLRTQSDLDSLLTRLDRHLHDSTVLLRHNPSPTTTSKRESAVRNLLTRLQIGSPESKSSAIDSLLALLQDPDDDSSGKNNVTTVAVSLGLVPALLRLLDSTTSPELKDKSVSLVARVSKAADASRHALHADGLLLLTHLLRAVDSGTASAKEDACTALDCLTSSSNETARAVGSRGGISSLLEACSGGTPSSSAAAAAVLRNLSRVAELRDIFVEDGAVPVLTSLLASGTAVARRNALGCLSNLVSDDRALMVVVVREGAVEGLKSYWDSTPPGPDIEPAVEFVANLATYRPIGELLVSEGFVGRVAPLLTCARPSVRISAARAVYELGFTSRSRREIGECGCVPPLAAMLEGKAAEERRSAAKAVSRLMLCEFNRKAFKREEKGIVSLVLLLDPLNNNNNHSADDNRRSGLDEKRWVVSGLTLLAESSKKCRKEMVAAGAVIFLQKLVEMEVDGARKLLECLGRGRLWGRVFSRPGI